MASNILIDLSEYLKYTDILKLLLPIIDEYIRYTFKTNKELQQAVKTWFETKDITIIKYGPINTWNTQFITDMSHLFKFKINFNDDISYWDTSKVTNMRGMFWYAKSFNQPLNWDTSKVTDMEYMFDSAKSFNQNLNFDTSQVTDMEKMFKDAESFNQSLNSWDVNNVTDIDDMFEDCPISEENKPVFEIEDYEIED